jgi:Overcoming lysogenization defect protein-like, TOPRIM domain
LQRQHVVFFLFAGAPSIRAPPFDHPACQAAGSAGWTFTRRALTGCYFPRRPAEETYLLHVPVAIDLDHARAVVLVEGVSDQRAVKALANRSGRNLPAERVVVLAMGGATNIGRYLSELGPAGRDLDVAGLCDEAEVPFFRSALQRAGLGPAETRDELAAQRFFVCSSDLEDELIRALGVPAVEHLLAEHSDLKSFRIFQQQPDQRGKSDHARLRRFLGTRGGRKIEYAPLLIKALDVDRVPMPLAKLMAAI